MSSNHQSVYFPNLNGVRFIAAFAVFIHHVEQIKHKLNLKSIYYGFVSDNMGRLGVGLFFVLSGFLITYLLLDEKRRNGVIHAKNFYIRRILKIWPLYYIIFVLSFFVFPLFPILNEPNTDFILHDAHYTFRLILFMFFLPNLSIVLFNSPYLCMQTWSIGIEEQFYAIWPWIIGSKNPFKTLGKFVLIILSIAILLYIVIFQSGWVSLSFQEFFKIKSLHFLGQFRISVMIIGSGGAFLVFYSKTKILSFIYRKDTQLLVYSIFVGLLFAGLHPNHFNLEFYGLFFCFFILNVSSNPKSLINLNNFILEYLGRISYGIYIYHTTIVLMIIRFTKNYINSDTEPWLFNIIVYSLSILFTIIVCHLSFKYIETPILKLKKKFIM